MHVWNKLSAFKKGLYTNSVDPDETPQYAIRGVSSGAVLFAKTNTLLVIVDIKYVYNLAFIHFVLFGNRL